MKLSQFVPLLALLKIAVANPIYRSASASIVANSGLLKVDFFEIALETDQLVRYSFDAMGNVEYGCANKQGDMGKRTETHDFSVFGSAQFVSAATGAIIGFVVANEVPTPAIGCTKSETLTRISLSYSDINFCDNSNSACVVVTPVSSP